jgi:replicative DNA helicase
MKNISEIFEDIKNNPFPDGIKSHIKSLDFVINSFDNGELCGIFGRPGFGKTTLAITIAANNARDNKKIAYFTPNDYKNITQRFISAYYNFDLSTLQNSNFKELSERYEFDFKNICFKINTNSIRSVHQIEEYLSVEKFDLVIIDNFNWLYTNSMDSYNYIIEFCKSFKELAVKFDIPVIITGHMNRSVLNRGGDMRPIISDIRDFSYIEIVADKLIFIHRPAFYGFSEDEEGKSTDENVELHILKNNHGPITTIHLKSFTFFSKFHDITEDKKIKQNVVLKRVE